MAEFGFEGTADEVPAGQDLSRKAALVTGTPPESGGLARMSLFLRATRRRRVAFSVCSTKKPRNLIGRAPENPLALEEGR